MRIAFEGIKKGFLIFWDESIKLIFLNFLVFLSLLPALLFFSVTAASGSVLTSFMNTLLILPFSFFVFALYRILYDCRQGIVIGFKSFFRYLRLMARPALIFGVINLFAVLMVGWNLRFYAQFEEAWAGIFQLTFLSLTLIWATLQLIMLPLYPRLEEPSFRLALKNAAAIMGRYLLPVLALVLWTALFVAATFYVQILGLLVSFVFIAVLGEGIVGEIVIDVQEVQKEARTPKT